MSQSTLYKRQRQVSVQHTHGAVGSTTFPPPAVHISATEVGHRVTIQGNLTVSAGGNEVPESRTILEVLDSTRRVNSGVLGGSNTDQEMALQELETVHCLLRHVQYYEI